MTQQFADPQIQGKLFSWLTLVTREKNYREWNIKVYFYAPQAGSNWGRPEQMQLFGTKNRNKLKQ